jgi:hypothetical protein
LLTTTSTAACKYLLKGHFGRYLEVCSKRAPCPSAYKQCTNPNCGLLDVLSTNCKTNDKAKSLVQCTL